MDNIIKSIKLFLQSNKLTLFLLVLYFTVSLLIGVYIGLNRIIFSDFFPMNGDFQNYNGYRRLLDGQIPFKDFYYYLGLGPLYIHSLFLFIVGNDFTSSLFITNFLSTMSFIFAIYIIARVSKSGVRKSFIIAICLILSAITVFPYISFPFLPYYHPGNSDRMIRGFLPFLLVFLLLLYERIKFNFNIQIKDYLRKRPLVLVAGIGFVAGASLSWSNDYGTSSFIAIFLIFLLINFKLNRSFLLSLISWCIGSIIGCVVIVGLLTKGNVVEWFNYNFVAVAGDQFWYYDVTPKGKLLTVYDIPFNFRLLIGYILIITLGLKVRKEKLSDRKTIYLLFLFLTTMIAGYAYAFGSSKTGLFHLYYMVLYVFIIAKLIKVARSKWFDVGFIVLIFSLLIPPLENVNKSLHTQRDTRVPELNGYLNKYGDGLNSINTFLNNKKVFSIYASAIEVVTNQYQPTGIDYIIHAMGDKYREKYIDTFQKQDFEYAITMNNELGIYVPWYERANWYFMRELYRDYKPVAKMDYALIWARDIGSQKQGIPEKTNLSITKTSDNTVQITLDTDPMINNRIIEVQLDYKSTWKENRIAGLGLRKIVYVSDGWTQSNFGTYNIPNDDKSRYIPILIKDGKGSITIGSLPESLTTIEVKNVTISGIYSDEVGYDLEALPSVEPLRAANVTDDYWINGRRKNDNVLLFQNKDGFFKRAKDKKQIVTKDGYRANIIKVEEVGEWVHVYINGNNIEKFDYPNILHLSD